MRPVLCGYLLLWASSSILAQTSPPKDPAPLYVESSIANSANPRAEGLAPNTLTTIYGQYLANVTRGLGEDDIAGGVLPTTIRGTGVRVLVGNILAPVLFVSPTQINFVVPSNLLPGNSDVRVGLDSRYGPSVKIRLTESAPALFQMDPEFVIAMKADGGLFTRENPAHGSDVVILYATGLGGTTPSTAPGQMVKEPAVLSKMRDFRVDLNGSPLSSDRILYAGLTPGFAGLYQINLRLPAVLEKDPVIRAGFGDRMSPDGLRLHAE